MENHSFKRGFFVTIHVPSYLTNGHLTERGSLVVKDPTDYFDQISPIVKKFYRRLERKCFKKHTVKNGIKRLEKLTVIEGCYNRNKQNHIHLCVEIPQHLTEEQMEIFIRESHGSLLKSYKLEKHIRIIERGLTDTVKPTTKLTTDTQLRWEHPILGSSCLRGNFEMGSIFIVPIEQYGTKQRLYTYITKEVKEGRNTVDWKNTYHKYEWSKSLQIKKEKHSRKRWVHGSRKERRWLNTPIDHFHPLDHFMTEKPVVRLDTSLLSRSKILVSKQSHVESNLCGELSQ